MTKAKSPKLPRRVEYLPLDDIQFAARNPKLHDTDGIAGSIGRFGMAAIPTRDERTGRLVAGHGRIESLRRMQAEGQAPPAGVKLDKAGGWLVPVLAGWTSRSDAEAESYLVGDNQWTARASWEHRQLAEMLEEINDAYPELMEHTGFTTDRLEDLIASFDEPTLPEGGDGDGGDGDGDSKGEDDGWPALFYQVPREVHDEFMTAMQLVGPESMPDHWRVGRLADLATKAVERDL